MEKLQATPQTGEQDSKSRKVVHGLPGLKYACFLAQTSIPDLSFEVRKNVNTLYNLFKKRQGCSVEVLVDFADRLKCSTDLLLGRAEIPREYQFDFDPKAEKKTKPRARRKAKPEGEAA